MDRLNTCTLELLIIALCSVGCASDAAGSPSDAGAARGSPAKTSLDDAASQSISREDNFAIALSTSDCREGCPMYDVKVDHGMAVFNGRGNTRQQGMIVKPVAPETIAQLHQAIDAANFWGLRDAYRNAGDGCTAVDPERATYTWNVSAASTAKIVVDYQGCQGVLELEALRTIPQLLSDKLKLGAWITPR